MELQLADKLKAARDLDEDLFNQVETEGKQKHWNTEELLNCFVFRASLKAAERNEIFNDEKIMRLIPAEV